MTSCDHIHDEILFFGGECPVCIRDGDIEFLKQLLADYKAVNEKLKIEIDQKYNERIELQAHIFNLEFSLASFIKQPGRNEP